MTTLQNIAAVWWVAIAQVAALDTLLPLFEPDQINGLGVMLSDKKPGTFRMQVEWVKVMRTEK